jgi:hypothetical protein
MVKSGFAFAADCSIRLNGVTVMRSALLTLPEVALIAATRGMLGAGIGLLVAPRLHSIGPSSMASRYPPNRWRARRSASGYCRSVVRGMVWHIDAATEVHHDAVHEREPQICGSWIFPE